MANMETEQMLMNVPSIVCGRENSYRALTLLRTVVRPDCSVLLDLLRL